MEAVVRFTAFHICALESLGSWTGTRAVLFLCPVGVAPCPPDAYIILYINMIVNKENGPD